MKCERPIIFSGEMVRAILDGRKTQTRRVLKDMRGNVPPTSVPINPGPNSTGTVWLADWPHGFGDQRALMCPHGVVGDRLWLRETWCSHATNTAEDDAATNVVWDRFAAGRYPHIAAAANDLPKPSGPLKYLYAADFEAAPAVKQDLGPWRSPIHMPRAACRILLEIADVRVQRLHEISEDDAKAEGAKSVFASAEFAAKYGSLCGPQHRYGFAALWDSINAKRAPWDSNPYVWVITFKRIEA